MLVPLATSSRPVPLRNFYSAIYLYHDRPHLINRKLCGASTIFHYKIAFNEKTNKITDVITHNSLSYEIGKLKSITIDTLRSLVDDLLRPYDKNVAIDAVTDKEWKELAGVLVTVRILFPSHSKSMNTVEVVVFNKMENYVLFVCAGTKDKFTLVAPPFAYKFVLQDTGILQLVLDIEDADTASGEWLADKLFPKMLKWIEEYDEQGVVTKESLSLISVEQYCSLYKQLKDKYGKKMVEIWPENTDPLKFVYEDVAIATYLICLWSVTNKHSRPSFVDLGCGNGLLVYILSQEGYSGFGVDVRKRKIWDFYPSTTNLQVKSIIPSDNHLFSSTDWLIGNHSDELTPWIPVIAARSKSDFFLLPCCCYNFDATKYIRKNPGLSQYAEYLQYVEKICTTCGFTTHIDKLRIPSTKRTCLVSVGRNTVDFNQINANIDCMINKNRNTSINGEWIKDYQPRESKEKVRNCTQLDRGFVTQIIKKLTDSLLMLNTESNVRMKKVEPGTLWNAGCCLAIDELVKQLEPVELKQLKCECGGLQTLMKNHRYIFDVARGRVKIRPPFLRQDTKKYVEKPCWFLLNHPDGCLHTDSECAYSHLL